MFFKVSFLISSAVGLSSSLVLSIWQSKVMRSSEYLLCSQWSVVEVMIAASSKDLIQVLPLVRKNTLREPRVKTSEEVLGG